MDGRLGFGEWMKQADTHPRWKRRVGVFAAPTEDRGWIRWGRRWHRCWDAHSRISESPVGSPTSCSCTECSEPSGCSSYHPSFFCRRRRSLLLLRSWPLSDAVVITVDWSVVAAPTCLCVANTVTEIFFLANIFSMQCYKTKQTGLAGWLAGWMTDLTCEQRSATTRPQMTPPSKLVLGSGTGTCRHLLSIHPTKVFSFFCI